MEFKEKIKKLCQVKYVIILCLILLFLWWGSNAVLRYWSQPLSTDISYRFGETEQGVQFPLITLCSLKIFIHDSMFKECHDGSWNFINTLVSCLKRNKTSHMQDFHPEIRNIVEMVRLWTGSQYVNLHEYNGIVWTKVFNNRYGPCYTLDISKIDKFKHVSLEADQSPGVEFTMAKNNLWKDASLMLHTRFDLPDAYQLNGFVALSFNESNKGHVVTFRKKIGKKESTRKAPCVKHEYNTCKSIEDNQLVLERFHCSLPILYSGPHLDGLTPNKATYCSFNVTLKALDFILSKETSCFRSQTCDNVRFTLKHTVQETWLENKSQIFIVFENPEVEYHHSYISYDLLSLIGEIGGILGITLGASALTLFEFLYKFCKNCKEGPRTCDVSSQYGHSQSEKK